MNPPTGTTRMYPWGQTMSDDDDDYDDYDDDFYESDEEERMAYFEFVNTIL
jgi:hypothetical protein